MQAVEKGSRTQEERNAIARARLCHAALELFALKGYDSTTLSDIGVRAGYSRGLAQYHFGTKTALAELLLEQMGHRDTQTHLLRLPANATGEDAWHQLERHLQESWKNFCSMHDGSEDNLSDRGEMILSVTAIFSPDPLLRERLKNVSHTLVAHVRRALQLCVRDGVIRADVDAQAVAMFYVISIWGMVNALFADPNDKKQISAMVDVLKNFMNTLRQ